MYSTSTADSREGADGAAYIFFKKPLVVAALGFPFSIVIGCD